MFRFPDFSFLHFIYLFVFFVLSRGKKLLSHLIRSWFFSICVEYIRTIPVLRQTLISFGIQAFSNASHVFHSIVPKMKKKKSKSNKIQAIAWIYNVFVRRNVRNYHIYVDEWSVRKSEFCDKENEMNQNSNQLQHTHAHKELSDRTTSLNFSS